MLCRVLQPWKYPLDVPCVEGIRAASCTSQRSYSSTKVDSSLSCLLLGPAGTGAGEQRRRSGGSHVHPLLVAGVAFTHADVAAAGGCVATDGQLVENETATPTLRTSNFVHKAHSTRSSEKTEHFDQCHDTETVARLQGDLEKGVRRATKQARTRGMNLQTL